MKTARTALGFWLMVGQLFARWLRVRIAGKVGFGGTGRRIFSRHSYRKAGRVDKKLWTFYREVWWSATFTRNHSGNIVCPRRMPRASVGHRHRETFSYNVCKSASSVIANADWALAAARHYLHAGTKVLTVPPP